MAHVLFSGGVRNDLGSTARKIAIRPVSVDLGTAGEMIGIARGVFPADPPGGVVEIVGTVPSRRP